MKKITALLLVLIMSFSVIGTALASATQATVKYGVNFRTAPSTNSKVIRMLSKGEKVQVLEETNAYWLKVKTRDGRTGYISSNTKYTNYKSSKRSSSQTSSSKSANAKADAIIATAKSYIGRATYKFGVRDPKNLVFDCSSFTQHVFAKHGIQLKWGTRYQKNAGKYVSKSNLKKGDLVFFSLNGGKEIRHVGIYIGNGDFIHILNRKNGTDVHIANLNSGYWAKNYVTARRVI